MKTHLWNKIGLCLQKGVCVLVVIGAPLKRERARVSKKKDAIDCITHNYMA
jgi:hypothetical protein